MFNLDEDVARRQENSERANGDLRNNQSAPQAEYLRAKHQLEVKKAQRTDRAKGLKPKHPIMVDLDQPIAQPRTNARGL